MNLATRVISISLLLLFAAASDAQTTANVVRLDKGGTRVVLAGTAFEVEVLLDNPDPVYVVVTAVQHDPAKLQLQSIQLGNLSPLAPGPGFPPDFQELVVVNNSSGNGFIAICILSFNELQWFPPGVDRQVFIASYVNQMTTDGDTTQLEFVDNVLANIPQPPVGLSISLLGPVTLFPVDYTLLDLTIENDADSRFLRGACSGTGPTLGVSDVIAGLQFIFTGSTVPPCLSACDANDDGQISFADSLLLVSRLFGGVAPLPPPSAGTCGIDPTQDNLGCDTPSPPCAP